LTLSRLFLHAGGLQAFIRQNLLFLFQFDFKVLEINQGSIL